jgi:hypothetical protein
VSFFSSANGQTASMGNDIIELFLPGTYSPRTNQVIPADTLNGGTPGGGYAANDAVIVVDGGFSGPAAGASGGTAHGGTGSSSVHVNTSSLPTVPGAEGKSRAEKLAALRKFNSETDPDKES